MKSYTFMLVVLTLHVTAYTQDYDETGDYESMVQSAENKAQSDGRKVLETGRVMTLVNGEILPGSCWDYANAVYDRAGYSWGQRENIYKTVKAGPYADIGKIQYGDWLYYINHSYGDIEHSAIFVDWIDYNQKIALMLSYGGESRRQPARYLPYDLSSVYGITRANAKLGEVKTTSKTNTSSSPVVKKVTETKVSPVTPATVATSSSASVSGATVNGMKVESLKFGSNVDKMEIVGETTSFSGSAEKVYCWMRVAGGQGRSVKVKWYHNGTSLGDVQLDIRSNLMRTYAFRTISGRKGDWKVEVADPSGTILHSANFTVQ